MIEDRIVLKELNAKARFLKYEFLEQIGSGGEGVVWSGVDLEQNRIVAIKLNELNDYGEQKVSDRLFDRQVDKLLALRHPHILPLYDYGLAKNVHYLVSPYLPGGSLRNLLMARNLSFQDALSFAAAIAAGLDYLHDQNILHRDLKPSNILLDFSRNPFISDFGLARFIPDTTQAVHTGRGTAPYAPPEQIAMKAMTRQSDIFSFGILLFEMFTRQVPWNGEKILGIQQLYSRAELPDPCEINILLPPDLAKVLRRMTDASPASRPGSATEALNDICRVFGLQPPRPRSDQLAGGSDHRGIDARELLKRSLIGWEPHGDTVALNLTNFALVELEHKKSELVDSPMDAQHYFLHSSLVFGLDDNFWWNKVNDVSLKMEVASSLIGIHDNAITARVVSHLLNDQGLTSSMKILPGPLSEALIEAAGSVDDLLLSQQILEVLSKLSPQPGRWRLTAFGDELDHTLASLAINDSALGDQAAHLIGQIRSITAVNNVDQNAPEGRRLQALLEVQRAAGSLPTSISAKTRLSVSVKLVLGRFLDRPLALLAVFLVSFWGSVISVGVQNFFIIRIPGYMDAVRISVSVERGLFLGAFFGAGILLIRLIIERSGILKVVPRLAIATIIGGLLFSFGLFVYDILIVQIDLSGMLFIAGCMIVAFGFALARLLPSGLLKMVVTTCAVFFALALTWIIHVTLLGAGVSLSPMFYYEDTWSAWQIGSTMLIFSLPVSILGNLFSLD